MESHVDVVQAFGLFIEKKYLQIDTPHDLWRQLKKRFMYEKTTYLLQARSDWLQLHVMDFSDLMTFNAEIHCITAQLRLYGETIEDKELINKTLFTFPPTAALFAQQYKTVKFKTHAELISYLLLAEKQ